MDARKLNYPNNSIDLIYSAHVLEHFPHGEVPIVLKEWHRVLKNGGKVIVVVPNFDRFVDWFILRKPIQGIIYLIAQYIFRNKKIRSGRVLNDNFIADVTGGALYPKIETKFECYHKTLFNPESLEKTALNIGFSKAEQINLKKFPLPEVDPKKLHWSSMAFLLTK